MLLGDRRKWWEVEAGGRSTQGAAAGPRVMERREEKVQNWRRKAKNSAKAPRTPSSQPEGDAGGCSLRPHNEGGEDGNVDASPARQWPGRARNLPRKSAT